MSLTPDEQKNVKNWSREEANLYATNDIKAARETYSRGSTRLELVETIVDCGKYNKAYQDKILADAPDIVQMAIVAGKHKVENIEKNVPMAKWSEGEALIILSKDLDELYRKAEDNSVDLVMAQMKIKTAINPHYKKALDDVSSDNAKEIEQFIPKLASFKEKPISKWTKAEVKEAAVEHSFFVKTEVDTPDFPRNGLLIQMNETAKLNPAYKQYIVENEPEVAKTIATWLKTDEAKQLISDGDMAMKRMAALAKNLVESETNTHSEVAKRMTASEFNAVRDALGVGSMLYPASDNKPYKMSVAMVTDDYLVQGRLVPADGNRVAHMIGVFHELKKLPDNGRELTEPFFNGTLKKQLVEITYKDGEASIKGPTQFITVDKSREVLAQEVEKLRLALPKAHQGKLDSFLESMNQKLGAPAMPKQTNAQNPVATPTAKQAVPTHSPKGPKL